MEINTIAASFAGLSTLVSRMHTELARPDPFSRGIFAQLPAPEPPPSGEPATVAGSRTLPTLLEAQEDLRLQIFYEAPAQW